jgi:hypothetical protein
MNSRGSFRPRGKSTYENISTVYDRQTEVKGREVRVLSATVQRRDTDTNEVRGPWVNVTIYKGERFIHFTVGEAESIATMLLEALPKARDAEDSLFENRGELHNSVLKDVNEGREKRRGRQKYNGDL